MRRSPDEMVNVLAKAFVTFKALAEHSLTPSQTRLATDRAGNCLWALGVDECHGFKAVEPDPLGEIIDLEATRLVNAEPRA